MSYIAVVDYGAGNLMSVTNALDFLGIKNRVTGEKTEIERADAVILPGVGAFPDAMENLKNRGLAEVVAKEAAKKPLLGICLGAQLIFDVGYELRPCEGLGLIPGKVDRIPTKLKLPHMGWNALEIKNPCAVTKGIDGGYVYFVHSYMVFPENDGNICAVSGYDVPVTSIVFKGHIFGCQFHPEKSGEPGLTILKNFADLVR